ncbi:inactive receptor-like serine/threonine-protein kinase At2g40270 isoform X1 [Ziziphus jujuba]|uniref:Inactive receptor-like serine/threonine-protein kinase At2g40270 isoform X1 n=2 Tax=Ziziphus jujuba TaxID=326968 RepID=A0A6P3Z9B0_ZIZJJ|nr:inactive receptor-like serine/threonine-protein kinase At2g40270 isoform X1 [Ziziphus jujuba]
MDERWRFDRLQHRMVMGVVIVWLLWFHHNLSLCLSLNDEGLALLSFRERVVQDPYGVLLNWNNDGEDDIDPCSWFGVECSDGKVVVLNLKDLCLGGTLAPEIGKLVYIKSIILRNNSFSGNIPKEMGELKELEVLDLGYNNFSGSFPSDLSNNLFLTTLLLDNNRFLDTSSPEFYELKKHSEFQVDKAKQRDVTLTSSWKSRSIIRKTARLRDVAYRRFLQVLNKPNSSRAKRNNEKGHLSPSTSPSLSPSSSPSSSPSPSDSPLSLSPLSDSPSPSPIESSRSSPVASPPSIFLTPSPSPLIKPTKSSSAPANPPLVIPGPTESHSQLVKDRSKPNHRVLLIWTGVIGGALFILVTVIAIVFFRSSEVVTVKPWATGLSGQLQKAFVTGVPKLNRSELVAACEDFSNIIGFFLGGTVYKGTLSSGVEIAVTSSAVISRADWSKNLEEQFRKKIETLSKVNHKNFVNLIGFCEDDKPFTRMMVFEYAPNGTLFEHLHVKEAEHLDWGMRLRIAMGMAYCLDYMHQLTPPAVHKDLHSSSVYLTEDYAAKISDFRFWNEVTAAKMASPTMNKLETSPADMESNIYSFGVILFEMITGRIPYSENNFSLANWATDYLKGEHPLSEMVDPTLKSFQEEELEKLIEVIKDCVLPDPKQRLTMTEITSRLKEITAMDPHGATPKLSPLWWAELEIMSTES